MQRLQKTVLQTNYRYSQHWDSWSHSQTTELHTSSTMTWYRLKARATKWILRAKEGEKIACLPALLWQSVGWTTDSDSSVQALHASHFLIKHFGWTPILWSALSAELAGAFFVHQPLSCLLPASVKNQILGWYISSTYVQKEGRGRGEDSGSPLHSHRPSQNII